MSYQHDVFLSYRASGDWPKFVADHFLPKFQTFLDDDLGRKAEIFYSGRDIEYGDIWHETLAMSLARSRIMVCLWSKSYFTSRWCSAELRLMQARRQQLLTSGGGQPKLIVAVVIHDSEQLEPSLQQIQKFYLQQYATPWIAKGSVLEQKLAMKIKQLTEPVAQAIEHAPAYDPSWDGLISEELLKEYKESEQLSLPRLSDGTPDGTS